MGLGSVGEDWWLWLVLVIGVLFVLAINLYILVLWQHPDDKNEEYFPKALVLLGLSLCEGSILLLVLDSANNSSEVECNIPHTNGIFCGSLNMELAWSIFFVALMVMTFFLIPYTIFFYEEDDTLVLEGKYNFLKTFWSTSKYMIILVIIVGLTIGLMYTFLGYTHIPVKQVQIEASELTSNIFSYTSDAAAGLGFIEPDPTQDVILSDETVKTRVSFPVYVMGLMAFVGWFLVVFFAGVGFSALPIDYIRSYVDRPMKLNRGQLAALQASIQNRCSELIKIGSKLMEQNERERATEVDGDGKIGFFQTKLSRRRQKREAFTDMNSFKQMVYILNEDFEQMLLCKNYAQEFNPIKPVLWLIAGVLAGIVSLLWILHIILYILVQPPASPFLNAFFAWLDSWFPLFGFISFAIFSLYLLCVSIHGCFKVGIRIVWFTLHPMKLNGTYMNSFLFNVGVICLCTPAVLQFCVEAFSNYLSSAVINNYFNVQVQYLEFFHFFYEYNVFIIALLIMTGLAAIYLFYRPTDASYKSDEIQAAIQRLEGNSSMNPEKSPHHSQGVKANTTTTPVNDDV